MKKTDSEPTSIYSKFYEENEINYNFLSKKIKNLESIKNDVLSQKTNYYNTLIVNLKNELSNEKANIEKYYNDKKSKIEKVTNDYIISLNNMKRTYKLWSAYNYKTDYMYNNLRQIHTNIDKVIDYKNFYLFFNYTYTGNRVNKYVYSVKLIPKNLSFLNLYKDIIIEHFSSSNYSYGYTDDYIVLHEKPYKKDNNDTTRIISKYSNLASGIDNKLNFEIKYELDNNILLELKEIFDFKIYKWNSGYDNNLSFFKSKKALIYLQNYNLSAQINNYNSRLYIKNKVSVEFEGNNIIFDVKYNYYNYYKLNEYSFQELINLLKDRVEEILHDIFLNTYSNKEEFFIPKDFITIKLKKDENL